MSRNFLTITKHFQHGNSSDLSEELLLLRKCMKNDHPNPKYLLYHCIVLIIEFLPVLVMSCMTMSNGILLM